MREMQMLIQVWNAGHAAPFLVLTFIALNAVAAGEHNDATSSPDLPYSDGDLYADTWVATDALGRIQPGIAEAGPNPSGLQPCPLSGVRAS